VHLAEKKLWNIRVSIAGKVLVKYIMIGFCKTFKK
jgi:hypothetical protein